MTLSGKITPRVMVLALACSVWAAPVSSSNIPSADAPNHSFVQAGREASRADSPHQYLKLSSWNACGIIPHENYDKSISESGTVLKCNDGAKVYSVTENYASSRAAEVERLARLEGRSPAHQPWRIAQTASLADATIIELAKAVSFGPDEAAANQWAVMWRRDASLILIYGPDQEHVKDYYQTHYGDGAKK